MYQVFFVGHFWVFPYKFILNLFRFSLILIVNGYLKMQLITLCRVGEIFFLYCLKEKKKQLLACNQLNR